MNSIKDDYAYILPLLTNEDQLIFLLNEVKKSLEKSEGNISLFTKKQIYFFLSSLNKDVNDKHSIYSEFKIPKKNGGFRVIHAPSESLKCLLKCIDTLIRQFSKPHHRAFGFVNEKSIIDNAKIHVGKNYVYNIDLKDFFHSFDIQQVKWVFYNSLFYSIENSTIREKLAYTLASLVTYTIDGKRTLPQGSPCSPSITNMLCYRLDKKLNRLAQKHGAEFSRYADDISFSANHNIFKAPFKDELLAIIRDEKLVINPKKTRLQRANERQEVTGLTVNQDVNVTRKYIKELRRILYYCERYGIEKAQTILQNNRNHKKEILEEKKLPSLELFLKGKLNYLSMVKTKDHSTYLKLEQRFNELFPRKASLVQRAINIWRVEGINAAAEIFRKLKREALKDIDFIMGNKIEDLDYLAFISEKFKQLSFYSDGSRDIMIQAHRKAFREGLIYLREALKNPSFERLIKTARELGDSDEKINDFIELILKSNNKYTSEEWLDYYLLWTKDPCSLNMMMLSFDIENTSYDYYKTFISDLLNYHTISKTERIAVVELWGKEVDKKINEKLKILKEQTEKNETIKIIPENKNLLYHNPSEVTKLLNKFKENTALKWTTHPWDNLKYNSIESFINEINEDKSYLSLFNHNRDLLNLIKYFIYIPTTSFENNIPKYGWSSKLSEMKFGWQFPNNLLIEWCKIHYDNREINSRKSPFKFIIPRELRPKNKVKGIEIKYFEDVVNVFKTEIQFRDNYLENEILKLQNRMKDFEFIGLDSLRNLDFYTYTSAILASIETILLMIKKYETANVVQFKTKVDAKYLNLSITQPNSFPSKLLNIDNTKLFIGGELNAIAANLFSLADFSISTKFTTIDNQLIDGELKILHQESIAEWVNSSTINLVSNPIFEKNQSESTGFTYNITFKL